MKTKVHVFHCSTSQSTYGLTEDKYGANLPNGVCPRQGKWAYQQTIEIEPNDPALFGGPLPKEILADINSQGYYLRKIEITTTVTIAEG